MTARGARSSRTGLSDPPTCICRSNQISLDRKSTRLNSSHGYISYAVFCLKKKNYFAKSPLDPALFCARSAHALLHLSPDGAKPCQNVPPYCLPYRLLLTLLRPSPPDPESV